MTPHVPEGVVHRPIPDPDETRLEMERAGFTTVVLPSAEIRDQRSFIQALSERLPMDPPLVGKSNWDALSDSLWNGLHDQAADHFCIVWADTSAIARQTPADLVMALGVLADVARELADRELSLGRPKHLVVLIHAPRSGNPTLEAFRRERVLSLPKWEREVTIRQLERVLLPRIEGREDLHAVVLDLVKDLRELGWDLWSFDSDDDRELWCPDWGKPTGAGIVLTLTPGCLEVGWSTPD
jgi:hypothetical protein